jgi:uncharacterized protein DUF1844
MTTEEGQEELRAEDLPLPGGDFHLFVSKLGFQALIALGIYENPVTGSTERQMDHAKMVIEDLRMLKERTRGNLKPDEEAHIGKVLADLQVQFWRVAKESGGG